MKEMGKRDGWAIYVRWEFRYGWKLAALMG